MTATNLIAQPGNNSPLLAVDPTEPRFVLLANRLDGPDFGCALQASGDGGRSWITVDPVPQLPEGAEKCYAPEVAFDADGVVHYLFVGLAGGGNEPMGVFLTTSTDRAQSFSPPRRLLGPNRYQARMAIDRSIGDRGRLHLVWLEVAEDPPLGGLPPPPNPIMAAYSDDGGNTFSHPRQVSDPARPLAVAPALAVGADSAVHVLYYDLGDDVIDYRGLEGDVWEGHWSLVVASSPDGGRHFEPGRVVDDALVPPERVMLIFTMPPAAMAPSPDGGLYVAWYDGRNGDWDVFLRRSDDGGRTWGDLRRLNDDPVGRGSHQYLPQLDVSPDGRLDAIFYDRRNNVENRGNDVYYTYSSDEGRSFAPNVRLTRLHFDSRIGARYFVRSAVGLVEFGSRIALESEDDKVLAAWTDTRNTGRAPRSQDIYATQLLFPEGPGGPGWAHVWAVGSVVAGLVTVGFGWTRVRVGRRRAEPGAAATSAEPERDLPRRGSRSTASSPLLGGAGVAAVVVAASCTAGATVLPPAPPVVHVTMDEHRFEIEEDSVPPGRVVFSVKNVGDDDHRLALIPLPDDFPPIHEQVRSREHRFVQELAAIPDTPPGSEAAFAVDLERGRYGVACFAVDGGETHAEKGMVTEFRVE